MAKRSQVIQRNLPRPIDLNLNILRPSSDMLSLTDLQKAEELIKQEMTTMMAYDAMRNPVMPNHKRASQIMQNAQNWLDHHPYVEYTKEELDNVITLTILRNNFFFLMLFFYMLQAKKILTDEMAVVKEGMAHGDLSLDAYSTVWEECLSQVMR